MTRLISSDTGNIKIVPATTGDVEIGGNSSGPAELRLMEDSDNGTNYLALVAPASVSANVVYTLPAAPAANGYVLQSTTGGTLSWSSQALVAANGILGTATNDSASAGNVGETITATGSAVAITTNVQTNVTSISLTAGDWLVYGSIKSNPAAGTTTTETAGGINTTSATLPTIYNAVGTGAATISTGTSAPTVRVSISGTTTVYLVARIQYAVSTCTVSGTISGVRIR